MNKKTIPIFFACDDNYIPFLAVALHTLIKNASKEYNYDVIVLNTNNITQLSKDKLKKYNSDHVSVSFYDISETINKHIDALSLRLRDYYSVAIYYRMFIPTLFPQYDKAVYLDGDLVVLGDISEFYNHDIEGKLIAGITDRLVTDTPPFVEYIEKGVGIKAQEYFNSGVILMNLKEFRTQKIEEKFLDLLYTYNFNTCCPDQDYLNILCRNSKVLLPIGWNKMPLKDETFDVSTLKLVHYNSFEKPWHRDNVLFEKHFWDNAQETEFYPILRKIKDNFTKDDLAKIDKGVEKLVEKALYIGNTEEITFKKILKL